MCYTFIGNGVTQANNKQASCEYDRCFSFIDFKAVEREICIYFVYLNFYSDELHQLAVLMHRNVFKSFAVSCFISGDP